MTPTPLQAKNLASTPTSRIRGQINVARMIARIQARRPARIFLREWRLHRNLTQEQLSERVGTDKGTLSKWENGKRAMNTDILSELALALQCEPFDLYRDPARPTPSDLLRDLSSDGLAEVARFADFIRQRKA